MNTKDIVNNAKALQILGTEMALAQANIEYPNVHFSKYPLFEFSDDGLYVYLTEDTVYDAFETTFFVSIDGLSTIQPVVSPKEKMITYLNKRIKDESNKLLKIIDLGVRISKGAKLTAYKEALEYLKTQID